MYNYFGFIICIKDDIIEVNCLLYRSIPQIKTSVLNIQYKINSIIPFFSSSLVLLSPNIVKNINLALESGGSLVASEGIGNVGKDDLDPNWVGLGDLSLYLILRFSNLAISTSENEKRTLS